MKIAVVYNQVSDFDSPDARDVLVQVEVVSESLRKLGHEPCRIACTLNLESMRKRLIVERPDLVFNLVEDLDGYGRLIHLFPFLLDALRIPYTGSPAEVILLSSNKTLTKERMVKADLPTPAWTDPYPSKGLGKGIQGERVVDKWIIKSLWEHASVGLDSESIVAGDSKTFLKEEMKRRCDSLGGACFAEEFIEGREFNISLLADSDGPKVLPPAEIVFDGFSPEMPRIVDYKAKWEEDSFRYVHTPRRFDFSEEDGELLEKLRDLSCACWHAFGLAGYARVDFRVDSAGRPFILEINANPCISPDAGFVAALTRAGIDFDQATARIISHAAKVNTQFGELS